MSDRDATAETKEPYALARRGLPLRGLAPSSPRAHWLPPVARAQAVPASRALEPPQVEASALEDGEFDPFAVSAPLIAPSPQLAPSPLIRDAGAALSIIADEGFEREAPATMSSRAMFDSLDSPAPPRTSPATSDMVGSETHRTALSAANERPTQHSTRDPFASAEQDTPATTSGLMSSPSPIAFDASATTETTRTAAESQSANVSAPRGAIASREREVASIQPVAPSAPIKAESPQVAVSGARQLESTPSSATASVAPNAYTPSSDTATQARNVPPGESASPYERREIVDVRNDAFEYVAATLRHETVEMGSPSVAPSIPRETGDAPSRAFAPPRSLDAAQIASLLSPASSPSASSGPSVTIDRVQVTVQTPAAARPAPSTAPVAQQSAAQKRQAPSPGYQNPWASYFARRD